MSLAHRVPSVAKLKGLVLLAVLLVAPAEGAPARRALQEGNVTVAYYVEDESFARTALAAARQALPLLEEALGLSAERQAAQRPVRIEVARRQADFDRLAGRDTPPWVQAIALPRERRIVLKTLLPAVARTVVAHELTHLLLDEMAREVNVEPPRWLHEGLAKWAAEDFTEGDREVLGRAVVEGRLLRFRDLSQAFDGDREQVALAYAQSYTLVRYLHELHPGGGIRQYLQNLALTGDAERSLLRTYGQPPAVLEEQWLAQTQDAYLKHGLPLTTEAAIFAAMTILAVVAFLIQSRRRRLLRQRLQEEERLCRMFGESSSRDTPSPAAEQPPGESPDLDQNLS